MNSPLKNPGLAQSLAAGGLAIALILFASIMMWQSQVRWGWPEKGIIPFDCDGFGYMDAVQHPENKHIAFLDWKWGREQNWPSITPLTAHALKALGGEQPRGISKNRAGELYTLLATPILLLLLTPALIWLLGKTSSYGIWAVPFALTLPGPFWAWSPDHPGHRGLIPYLALALTGIALKCLQKDLPNRRAWVAAFGILGGISIWNSALISMPLLGTLLVACTLADTAEIKLWKQWDIFALAITATTLLAHRAEYGTGAMHFENVHPFEGMALGGAALLAYAFNQKRLEGGRLEIGRIIVAAALLTPLPTAIFLFRGDCLSLLEPIWKALSKEIVEQRPTGWLRIFTDNIFLWMLAGLVLAYNKNGRARLIIAIGIASTVFLCREHFRLNIVSTPMLAGLALGLLPDNRKAVQWAMILVACQIAAGTINIGQKKIPSSDILQMRTLTEEIRKTDDRKGITVIGPMDAGFAIAYYLDGHTTGALFWEANFALVERNQVLGAHPDAAKKKAQELEIDYIVCSNIEPDPLALADAKNKEETLTWKINAGEKIDWLQECARSENFWVFKTKF